MSIRSEMRQIELATILATYFLVTFTLISCAPDKNRRDRLTRVHSGGPARRLDTTGLRPSLNDRPDVSSSLRPDNTIDGRPAGSITSTADTATADTAEVYTFKSDEIKADENDNNLIHLQHFSVPTKNTFYVIYELPNILSKIDQESLRVRFFETSANPDSQTGDELTKDIKTDAVEVGNRLQIHITNPEALMNTNFKIEIDYKLK